MAEFKELAGFVLLLVFVGMLLGVGVLVLDNFGVVAKTSTTITDESVTMTAGAGQLANDDVTAVSELINVTDSGQNITPLAGNWTTAGVLSFDSDLDNGTWNVTYTYDADSTATTAAADTVSAIAPISSTWLPLIVTVFVLAIILVLVIRSFSGYGRR